MRQVSPASNYRWETNNNNDAFCILSALEADLHMSVMSVKFHLNSRELLIMPEHAISTPHRQVHWSGHRWRLGLVAAPWLLRTAAWAVFVCLRMDGMMQDESFLEPRHLLDPADIYSLSTNPKGDEHTPRWPCRSAHQEPFLSRAEH